jgi:hypothetical protein
MRKKTLNLCSASEGLLTVSGYQNRFGLTTSRDLVQSHQKSSRLETLLPLTCEIEFEAPKQVRASAQVLAAF